MKQLVTSMLSAVVLASAAFAAPPNIVILFSDDGGFADFGFQPDCRPDMKELTPNIDRVAAGGVRFTNGYVTGCVCSPSRAGLMTGRYQQRFGYDNNLPPGFKGGLSLEETFGTKRLKELGYTTGLVGKWHLGYPDEYHPNERGFVWFYGLLQGSRPYFPMKKISKARVILENREPTPEKGYVTDRFGDAACEFIREHKDEPFYLFVSFTAPHGPLQAKPEVLAKLNAIKEKKRRAFAGLVVSLDQNVGKVLDCLDEQGLSDNTIVVYTNDNGGQTATGANNFPLSGKKGTLLEGGVRVPFAMRWPGRIKPGSVIDDPVMSFDLLPTFVSIAGGTVKPEWKLDGVDLTKRLTGEAAELEERPLFWRQHGGQGEKAVRLGKWKLHRPAGSSAGKLFNLDEDVAETNDVSAKHPEMKQKLETLLDDWNAQLKEPLWGKNAAEGKKKRKKG